MPRLGKTLTLVSCALLALFTASCSINPWHAEALSKAARMNSIEEFGRDIEPTIIATRNEVVTSANFIRRQAKDSISDQPAGKKHLYTFVSSQYFFAEQDVTSLRSTFDNKLSPLGFTLEESVNDKQHITWLLWKNTKYGVTVTVRVHNTGEAVFYYSTEPLKSDGSTEDPKQLPEIPGRVPDWAPDPTPQST